MENLFQNLGAPYACVVLGALSDHDIISQNVVWNEWSNQTMEKVKIEFKNIFTIV